MTKRELEKQLKLAQEREAEHLALVKALNHSVEEMTKQIEALNEQIEVLNKQIKDLKEKNNKNSKNSSKPPSSDGLKKPAPKSLRKSSGKKQGGQDGHQGAYLSVLTEPDRVEKHMPSSCEHCPHREECCSRGAVVERRTVLDANVIIDVTEHQAVQVAQCMLDGSTVTGSFPDNVTASVQYGSNLQALVAALTTVGAVSIKRTHEILGAVFNIPLSTGTISNMTRRLAERVMPAYESIRDIMRTLPLVHFDETGTRVDKKLRWVHNASNAYYTYLTISNKRGTKGMDEGEVLPYFGGVAVHDCWAPYWKYSDATHAVCCAHLLRELTGIMENHPDQKWAGEFMDHLLEMKKVKDKALASGKERLSYYYLHKFSKRYDELIEQAKAANPLPEQSGKKRGRKKKGKILALVERLEKYKAGVCLFVKDLSVPFDNNQAERDIRMVKVKTKVSGCFRSEDGAKDYLKIMSYVGTAKKHGVNAFEAILNAFNGQPFLIFE